MRIQIVSAGLLLSSLLALQAIEQLDVNASEEDWAGVLKAPPPFHISCSATFCVCKGLGAKYLHYMAKEDVPFQCF